MTQQDIDKAENAKAGKEALARVAALEERVKNLEVPAASEQASTPAPSATPSEATPAASEQEAQ